MATVIDNTGGDPTAFGKSMSDIGTAMINNRLNRARVDQSQQQIDAQKSQFDKQHELAKQQLDIQLQDFADKHRAFQAQMGGINANNQLLQADINSPDVAQPVPQVAPADVAVPQPPGNVIPPVTPSEVPTTPSEPQFGPMEEGAPYEFHPPVEPVAPVMLKPSGPTVKNLGAKMSDFIGNMLHPLGGPVTVKPMDASENTLPTTHYTPKTSGGFSPVIHPASPESNNLSQAEITPAQKQTQAVTSTVKALATPNTPVAKLLGSGADKTTSSIILSMLPPNVGDALKKIVNDPQYKDVPMGPILQDYLKLKIAPLEQQVAAQDLQNKSLQGQLENLTTKQAIDMISGVNVSGGNTSPAMVNQMASVYVKKLGWSPDVALAQARSQAMGRPVLPKDQLELVASQSDKLNSDPIASAARENISSYDTIQKAASQQNGQGDLAMVDALNQIVNKPGIKVSEGNVHLIQDASAIGNKFSTDFWKNRFQKGDKLPEAERQKMLKLAKDITNAHVDYVVDNVLPRFEGTLEAGGVDKNYLGGEFRNYIKSRGHTPNSQPAEKSTNTGGRIVIQNGNRFKINPDGSHDFIGPAK